MNEPPLAGPARMRMFWSSRSPFARKAAMVAHECDLFGRLDLIDVPIPGPGPHPELNRATPIAKLPTLVTEGGLVIAGSPVICDYFDTLGQRGLIPRGGPERWRALSRQAMVDGMLDMLLLWRADLRRPDPCQSARQQGIYESRLIATLDRFEDETSAGGGFDIGDLATGILLAYLDFRFPDIDWRTGRGGLQRAYAAFSIRPSAIDTAFAAGD
ncbi:glutathione S-transferase family protein [Rhizorhabdus histidinilytica]|nr:glutathione S-transferase N-terminal domain-containing protein [Rhizorhabdus histidinilytica]